MTYAPVTANLIGPYEKMLGQLAGLAGVEEELNLLQTRRPRVMFR